MHEAITIIFIFTGVVAITAVVFAIWLVFTIVRWVVGGFLGLIGMGQSHQAVAGPTYVCPRRSCRATNPSSARFCRRCGQEFLRGQMAARRAAVM